MLTIIFIILGYIVIAGITAGILGVSDPSNGTSIFCGLFWPISIPLLIVLFIIFSIAYLINYFFID